jgi:hypothetical protein
LAFGFGVGLGLGAGAEARDVVALVDGVAVRVVEGVLVVGDVVVEAASLGVVLAARLVAPPPQAARSRARTLSQRVCRTATEGSPPAAGVPGRPSGGLPFSPDTGPSQSGTEPPARAHPHPQRADRGEAPGQRGDER